MGDLGEALKSVLNDSPLEQARRQRPQYPQGWEPGIAWDGSKGVLTTAALDHEPDDWAPLLAVWNLDPQRYAVVPPVQYRAWDTNIGGGETKRLFYYRATVVLRQQDDRADIEALIKEVRSHKPIKKAAPTGESDFLVVIADPQLGKSDGDGTEGTTRRWLRAIDGVQERYRELRKMGRSLGRLVIVDLGDIFENCAGFYPQQAFRVELNHRDQMKLGRRLFTQSFKQMAPDFTDVLGVAVGGNHGERRNETGKSFTDFGDNDDVAVIEQVAEILSENPERYGHVKFVIPQNELSVTLDLAGTVTTFAHGHQFFGTKRIGTSATNIGQKALNWWAGQAHGMQSAGDSTLLISGHFHHLLLTQEGAKTHIQAPALDGGSEWFTNTSGQDSPAGVLTLVVGSQHSPRGWDDLKVV